MENMFGLIAIIILVILVLLVLISLSLIHISLMHSCASGVSAMTCLLYSILK